MILLYHAVIPDGSPAERSCVGQALPQAGFERHLHWLAKNYHIIPLAKYLTVWQKPDYDKGRSIAITFDDGLAVTFQCIFPILSKMNIPATIFVSSGHLEHGELLWFSYLKALCFESLYKEVTVDQYNFPLHTLARRKRAWTQLTKLAKASTAPSSFSKMLALTYPLSPEVTALYEGMTYEQLKTASESSVIELGAHTISHPYLDQLTRQEQEQQIQGGSMVLSNIIGKPIRYFAFPGGHYNLDTLDLLKESGYEASFATLPQNIGMDPQFEIGRIGIYSQSLLKLQAKTLGLASWGRKIGLRIG